MSVNNPDYRDTGAGPFIEDIPALDPGEKHHIDYRNKKRNGRKGWYRPLLPLDSATITNNSSQSVRVTYNNRYEDEVVPNTIESWEKQGITYITVENTGSSATNADEISVAVKKEPYDADDRAREKRNQGPIQGVIENFTGIGL